MLFATQKVINGVSKLAVAMPGVEFIARTMTKIAVAGNSVLQVFGARQLAHQIMANKFDGLSINVLPGKALEMRFAA